MHRIKLLLLMCKYPMALRREAGREFINMDFCNCLNSLIFKFIILFLLSFTTTAQFISTCSEEFQLMIPNGRNMTKCNKLTTLKAEFGWGDIFTNASTNESTFDIFFGATLHTEEGWVAWGVNPGEKPRMVGTRAIIGIIKSGKKPNISTYNITMGTKIGCQLLPSEIELFSKPQIAYNQTGLVVMSATLTLPANYNISGLNHVWQVGCHAAGVQPMMHPTTLQNVDSTETINLKSGAGHGVGKHRRHLRMVHGVLNIIGWGTLLPLGVIIARYFRRFPIQYTYWFVVHVYIQIMGYTLGTIGWIIGLVLGHCSSYYSFRVHRILAIFIFTFTTLQMLALRLRPEPNDEYKKYWDMYHHFLGYALLAVISVNIFQGISILRPDQTWKWAYIGVLGALGFITLVMEIFTWVKFIKQQHERSKKNKTGGGDKRGGGGGEDPRGGGGPPE